MSAKLTASKLDNPNWPNATCGEFADEYWNVIREEMTTLESMGAWEVVNRDNSMNISLVENRIALKSIRITSQEEVLRWGYLGK